MLLIFGAVFRNDVVPGVSYADYMLPAMISTGTIVCCLLTLAIAVAGERESGELMRLAVLPDFFAATDPTGSWETGKGLAVIGAWIVGGVVLAFIVARRDPVDR
ncbi:hypothetical protein OHJ16_12600 [Actinomyces israelii]|uniref:ABC transporter permease n=1 Tax=Actinomyces israelii TaxID=1659 RepID=A0ABT4IAW9_9ACTO|nr:hypothetical protein [Actinomyces israelii]MCZ0858880.1 hypothetical protein [Actinomyces israelii]WKR22804.1 hypothetical protein AIF0345_2758 [Actinomyces israelii]